MNPKQTPNSPPANVGRSPWRSLYMVSGAAALTAALLGIVEIAIEMNGGVGLASAPDTAAEWFMLLQNNRLLGLAVLGIFETTFFPLGVLMFLGMYVALRRFNESFMAIATSLYFIGTTIYFSTNAAFSMLSLSNQYATATEAQRSVLLAAGQAVLVAANEGTGNYMVFLLGSLAGLIVSVVMLRSRVFGKSTAYVGIAANLLGLPGPALGLIVWSLNGVLMLVWLIMVGKTLLTLGKTSKQEAHSEEVKQ